MKDNVPNSTFRAVIFDLNGVIIQQYWPKAEVSMIELVKQLSKNGVKTAVLSNLSSSQAQHIRDEKWSKVFDMLGFSGEMGVGKPDPRSYQIIADELDIPSDKIIFVDDDPYRLRGAESIGMRTHLFTHERLLRDELSDLGLL